MMKKKDPEETGEDPTRVDLEAPEFAPTSEGEEGLKEVLDLAPDIPVQLVAVMGRKEVTVKDLLDLRMGQVIDFNHLPTEPVDVVVAGKVIGKGELVEVDGKLGIRILKLLK